MPFNCQIDLTAGGQLALPVEIGQTLFVVGANGSGKSSLMQRLYRNNRPASVRITAHRQTWLSSNTLAFSPEQKRQNENVLSSQDAQDTARWKDDYAAMRTGITIYELLDAENVRSRSIAAQVDAKNVDAALKLAEVSAPIGVINKLLQSSNLPLEVSIEKSDSIVARKAGGAPYSVAELSDGERNALLIGANVLTSPAGSLILIDEPERHLHRSIIAPFLNRLFSLRADCAFIVSTHDIGLPIDYPEAQTLLVRSCVYAGSMVTSWDADLLAENADIDERTKADVLGGRRKLLFIEGVDQSLDSSLYALLFPGVSIIPKESCRNVEQHVRGIREAENLVWVKAFGIVDRDQATLAEVEAMELRGVYALNTYSVESLYYHPEVQEATARRHATVVGGDADARLAASKAAALADVVQHVQRLAARMTEKSIRDELTAAAPNWQNIQSGAAINIKLDVQAKLGAEVARLNGMLAAKDLASVIARYPVKSTGIIQRTWSTLGFANRAQYEDAVRTTIMADPAAKSKMLSFFGNLPAALQAI